MAIAATVEGLDADLLAADLAKGVGRADLFADLELAQSEAVSMSPHLFLPDGSSHTNPGLEVHWQGDWAAGFPVVDSDDPTIYESILRSAAAV